MRHTYPGNVRELENIIERAILNSENRTIHFEDLPENIRGGVKGNVARRKPSARLVEGLRSALLSGDGGPARLRTKTIRVVKLEEIAVFLSETGSREFSRKDFAAFLRRYARHDVNERLWYRRPLLTIPDQGRSCKTQPMQGQQESLPPLREAHSGELAGFSLRSTIDLRTMDNLARPQKTGGNLTRKYQDENVPRFDVFIPIGFLDPKTSLKFLQIRSGWGPNS